MDMRCHWCRKKLTSKDKFDLYGKNRDNTKVWVCDKCAKQHSSELHSCMHDLKKSKLTRG